MSSDLQCTSCLLPQDGEHEKRRSMANVIYLEWDETWDKRHASQGHSAGDGCLEERTFSEVCYYITPILGVQV